MKPLGPKSLGRNAVGRSSVDLKVSLLRSVKLEGMGTCSMPPTSPAREKPQAVSNPRSAKAPGGTVDETVGVKTA